MGVDGPASFGVRALTASLGQRSVGWFPNLTRAYDINGRCPRQKFVFGILQPTLCVLLLGIYAKDANQCSAERGRQLTVKSRHTHAHSDAPLLLAASRFV